jgi:DNA-binding transcriptional LysR family regulator
MGAGMQLSDRIGRRMKLHDLHVLLAVVQTGSMSKAAVVLNTTQPAISRSIAELESVVGVRLLERNAHGVEPTKYGRALLECGAAVFDDLRQGINKIEFLADPTAGELRVGSHHFLSASLVPAVIDRLSRRYPRIVFHVLAGDTDTLYRELKERKVDLLLAWKYREIPDERLRFEHLYDDRHVVAVGAKSSLSRRRRVRLEDLLKESWTLAPPESVLGSISIAAFRASGFDYPRATAFSLPTEARLGLLATGRFLTIVSTSVLTFPAKRPGIKVLPVDLPIASMPIGIVTVANRSLNPAVELFIDCAREVAKSLP